MTSRERVRMALRHQEADMVPIDFGGMRSTGINAIAYNRLKDYLGIKGETKVYDIFQQLAKPEPEVLRAMGGDVIQLDRLAPSFGIKNTAWKPSALMDGSPCLVPEDFNPVTNGKGGLDICGDDGIPFARRPKGGHYFDLVRHRLAHVESIEDLDGLQGDEISDEEQAYLAAEAKHAFDVTDYAILGAFGGNIFEAGQMDFGYETYFAYLAIEPDIIHAYNRIITDAYMRSLKKYLDAVGRYIDVIQFGDDLGTQQSSQISVPMYREMIKPYQMEQYQFVRKNYPEVKVFLHSCGAINSLIPDLIDAGVEVLNPVQLSARGMDAAKLKAEYGDALTFWGGGVSTQTTLTTGSIAGIENEVRENMRIFAPGGGFVFTQIHNIQANIPPEKIMAGYNTAAGCRRYAKGV